MRALTVDSTTVLAASARTFVDVGVQVGPSQLAAVVDCVDATMQTDEPQVADASNGPASASSSAAAAVEDNNSDNDGPSVDSVVPHVPAVNLSSSIPTATHGSATPAAAVDLGNCDNAVETDDSAAVVVVAREGHHWAERDPKRGTRAASWPGSPVATTKRASHRDIVATRSWPGTPSSASRLIPFDKRQSDDSQWLSFLRVAEQQQQQPSAADVVDADISAVVQTNNSEPAAVGVDADIRVESSVEATTVTTTTTRVPSRSTNDAGSLAAADAAAAAELNSFGVRYRSTLVCSTMHAHFSSWSLTDDQMACSL